MMKTKAEICITYPEQSEELDVFGGGMTLQSDPTNMPFLLVKHMAPPGYSVPLHVHEHDDEFFVVLEGELTVFGALGETRIGPGVTVELPRGIPHGYRNDTAAPVQLLVMALPGQYALEMFRHFDRAGKSPSPFTPADIPAIAGQYGVRFV